MKGKEKTIRLIPHYIPLILIILVGFIAYGSSLKCGFVFDDRGLIINNLFIKDFSYLKDIFTTQLAKGSGEESNFYRPIQSLSFMLDYRLWKLNPFGYHLTNVLLHIFNAICAYFLISLISKKQVVGFITALLFCVHTVLSSVIYSIVARDTLLCTFFFLISVSSYILYREGYFKRYGFLFYSLSLSAFLLAILSREIGVLLPFIILFYLYCFSSKNKEARLKGTRPNLIWVYFIIIAVYAYLRATVLNFTEGKALETTIASIPLYNRLLTTSKVIMIYLRLLLLPIGLHAEWDIKPAVSFFQDEVFLSMVGLFIIGGFIYYLSRTSRLKFFAIGWFFIGLLPYCNIIPINYFLAPGWLYIPSIGFFALVAIYLSELRKRSRQWSFTVSAILVFAIVSYGLLTIKRAEVWADPTKFYTEVLKYSPSNKAHMNIGLLYKKRGDFKKAMDEYKKALELNPNYPQIYNNIGNIYLESGRYDEAISSYLKAISLDPNTATFYKNLGKAYKGKGMSQKARESFEKTLRLDPNNKEVLDALKLLR